jgi:hypothetical protein
METDTTGVTNDDRSSSSNSDATGSTTTAEPTSNGTTESTGGETHPMADTGSTGENEVACDPSNPSCSDDEKCQMYPDGESKCVSAPSPAAAAGDRCAFDDTGVDNCQQGSLCWSTEAANFGTCVALCDLEEPTCNDPSTACGLPWPNAGAGVCLSACDPLAQDCVQGGCYPGELGSFLCYPTQGGSYGNACTGNNQCSPGLLCVDPAVVPGCAGADGCCTEFCDLSDPGGAQQCSGVAGGQECISYYTRGQAPPDYVEVGICWIPE